MDAKDYIAIPGDVEIPAGTIEDFKRPDHLDFMTVGELRTAKFTGLRHNSLTNDCEIWLCGFLEKIVSPNDIKLNPHAIDEAYADTFHMKIEARPDIPEVRKYREALARKDKL